MWAHGRSRSSPSRDWWAAFRSLIGEMFHKTHEQMNHWRGNVPRAFGDQVDRANRQTILYGMVQRTGEGVSWDGSDVPRAMIEPPSCSQYKPGDFLALRPHNWDEIINKDENDENWEHPGALSGGRRRPGDGNDNNYGEGKQDTQGGETGTAKGKGTKHGKGKGKETEDRKGRRKGKGNGNGNGKGIVERTPGGDDISLAVALQLQKARSEAHMDMEG